MLRNIEAERVRFGLSKDELAKELGISRRSYWNYVNEKNSIPSSLLIHMAQMFSVTVDYLLSRPERIVS